jgi:hypothetical protein
MIVKVYVKRERERNLTVTITDKRTKMMKYKLDIILNYDKIYPMDLNDSDRNSCCMLLLLTQNNANDFTISQIYSDAFLEI